MLKIYTRDFCLQKLRIKCQKYKTRRTEIGLPQRTNCFSNNILKNKKKVLFGFIESNLALEPSNFVFLN